MRSPIAAFQRSEYPSPAPPARKIALAQIIYLPRPSRAATLLALSLAQEGMLMSTYEEFMIIIAVAGLIVSILNLTHKK